MNFDDFAAGSENDFNFDFGESNNKPISQMFAEPLHVEDDGLEMQPVLDFGLDNFESEFGGFDEMGSLSTNSLPALSSMPEFNSEQPFANTGPLFIAPNPQEKPISKKRKRITALICTLLYLLLIACLIIIILLEVLTVIMVFRIDDHVHNIKMVITPPILDAPSGKPFPPPITY